jgi:splicing factor U2AF subunit
MGHRDRRPRREEDAYAAPMRGYSPPPRRDDRDRGPPGGEWRPPRDNRGPPGGFRGGRGGGGGGGYRDGGRDGGGGGGGRGRTPPRSPTPEGVVPLEERKVEHSLWDIRPMQFEGIGAMAAKMTGMFHSPTSRPH